MNKALEYIFMFLVFPGFLFSVTMGLLAGWVDRKVTARIQWRVGPPWYQNFMDIAKLFYKETLIPEGASRAMFLGMPLAALASASLVSTVILAINASPHKGFIGDLIVVVYLMMIPSIAIMLGGFASGNPQASIGASREMKLMLAYELPFLLSLVVPIIKAGYVIKLGDILTYQYSNGAIITSVSGSLSFLAMLLCIQAKLGFVPFDMPEAETELIGGPYIEYSGRPLAIFKAAKAVLLFILPLFLITLYFGGIKLTPQGLIKTIAEYIFILVLIILIKNTNPRVRIDHAVRFFWKTVTAMAIIAVIAAYLGY